MWLGEDEEAKMGLILSRYLFITYSLSSWFIFVFVVHLDGAKNVENIKDYRLNYRLFKQKNQLSTNSRYYRLRWPL